MHISRPIYPPEDGPARVPSERGFVIAVALFALLALSGSLWLSEHGVSVLACGEDPASCHLL